MWWRMRWLNWSIAILNITFQLLVIYRCYKFKDCLVCETNDQTKHVFLYLIPLLLCVCVFIKLKKKLSVVKSSHIDKVWYWEEIYHLFHDINCRMQFWCWRMSVFPYLIPLPLYVCVCLSNKNKWPNKNKYLILGNNYLIVLNYKVGKLIL